MPTPIDVFVRRDQDGDDIIQLGSSQEWDWRAGRFNGFQDRSVYLRRVRNKLLLERAPPASGGWGNFWSSARAPRYEKWEDIDREEDRRRHKVLGSLQAVLQSRRLKLRMLHEQMFASPMSFRHLQDEAYDNSRRLKRIWFDPYNRGMYSVRCIFATLKHDLGIPHPDPAANERTDHEGVTSSMANTRGGSGGGTYGLDSSGIPFQQISAVTGISDNPSHHIYPATALQKAIFAARPLSVDASFHAAPPVSERTRWHAYLNTSGAVRERLYRELLEFLTSAHCTPRSYFPELWPTTAEGRDWAHHNHAEGLRTHRDDFLRPAQKLGNIVRAKTPLLIPQTRR